MKIIIADRSRFKYCKDIFFAVGIGLSQLCIGGTLLIVFMFSMHTEFKDKHIILCTFAYHFFTAQAILSLNYTNGWSTPLRLRHRRFAHILLQICALSCALTGTTLVSVDKGISTETHGLTGLITAVMTLLTMLIGPAVLFGGQIWNVIHVGFGLPTFIISSICFAFGLLQPSFEAWAGSVMPIVLIVFICFYTTFIVIMSVVKCIMRIKYLM